MESSDSPRKSRNPSSVYTVTRHTYGPHQFNFGDLYLPGIPGPHPVVPLLHGGFWRAAFDLTLMNALAGDLARRGIAAWNIEYRRVGNKGGGWPGTLRDVARAVDYLHTLSNTERLHLDLQRVVPLGHSAGGHLALWLAARHRLQQGSLLATTHTPLRPLGAISLAGAVDLEHVWRLHLSQDAAAAFLGGSPAEVPSRYAEASPAALLPLGMPQILIHGTLDTNVPLEVSQAYERRAQATGDYAKLIELPGADHFVVIDPSSESWMTTLSELQALLALL